MQVPRFLVAGAALSALATSSFAQSEDKTLPSVTVTASAFGKEEQDQLLAPSKVLYGDELRNKLRSSLGDTLSHELGVSSSAFGAGASRPVIRGMDGPRVKILQNGMAVSDLSALSSDHAVGVEAAGAQQIEILRGPATLLYGSGAIGGLVNVVNQRIARELPGAPSGEAEVRYGSADREKRLSFSTDAAAGPVALHLDGNVRDADDYKIPGHAVRNDPDSASGRLPSSAARTGTLGAGASYIAGWGHLGISADVRRDRYGIPTDEQSFIKLEQSRIDLDGLIRAPFGRIDALSFKLAHTDYEHTEYLVDGSPATRFRNEAVESRWELTQSRSEDWRAKFGIQTEHSRFSAKAVDSGEAATVPATDSSSLAGFWLEERSFHTPMGTVDASAGARLESVQREPDDSAVANRKFTLTSWSAGGLWKFAPGYGLGSSVSLAERAPAAEELYSNGAHEASRTFDVGDQRLDEEKSRNLELSLQKTAGPLRWKANLFRNRVQNFIYGRLAASVDEDGAADLSGEFRQRFWSQGDATIRGAELELTYRHNQPGWSWRGFADHARGTLDGRGNLPLQPSTRYGFDLDFKQGPWKTGLNLVHAERQQHVAAFESEASAYTLLDAHWSYTQRQGAAQLTWFAMLKNLSDEEVRLSTSLLKDAAPQAGRSLVVGLRVRF